MQRLQFDTGEQISRKEYLKRKRKNSRLLRKRSKITYILLISFIGLAVYICVQLGIYRRYNHFQYIAGENVKNQAVYNIFFVTEGYTYDPVYSVSSMLSSGEKEKSILPSSGIQQIAVTENYIYGVRNGAICEISRDNYNIEEIINDDIKKFIVNNGYLFYTSSDNATLKSYNIETKETIAFDISSVSQILANDNNVFAITHTSEERAIYRFNYDGQNRKKLTSDQKVSYAIVEGDIIYFVNKSDSDYIYSIDIHGKNCNKVADIKSVTSSGELKEVNGGKYMFVKDKKLYYVNKDDSDSLWCYDLESKDNTKIISASIEILQNVDDTIFYKINKEMGVYLYNYETKFMSLVTKRRVKEFVIDKYDLVDYTQVEVDETNI